MNPWNVLINIFLIRFYLVSGFKRYHYWKTNHYLHRFVKITFNPLGYWALKNNDYNLSISIKAMSKYQPSGEGGAR